MGYDMNGWQSGPRRPITYNLRPGQMRGMGRVKVGPGDVIVNNIFTNPNNGMVCHYCDESSGIPTWAGIAMGVGGGLSAIGTLMEALGGGGGETEGAGGEKTQPQTNKLSKFEQAQQAIKMLGKEYSVSSDADGNITYVYTDKDGNRYEGKNIGELNQKILDAANEKKDAKEVKHENKTTATDNGNKTISTNELKNGDIVSSIDGKLGENSKISGTVTNNADGTIGIKDNKHTFTYEKTSKKITYNGQEYEVYSLKGATDNATGKAVQTTEQEYILINGQLTQPADCPDLKGLGTGSLLASPPPDETTQVANNHKVTKTTKKTTNKTANNNKAASSTKAEHSSILLQTQGDQPKLYRAEWNKNMKNPQIKGPDNTQYTAHLNIAPGKYPTATFKDKTGKTHTFTGKSSGVSFSSSTREKAQIENIKEQIKAAGFTNVNIVSGY